MAEVALSNIEGTGRPAGDRYRVIFHVDADAPDLARLHLGPLPENLCCLCPAHHRLHHAGRLGIEGDPTTPDGLSFTDRRGRPIRGPSPRPTGAPPPEAAASMGLPTPRWNPPLGEPMDARWISWS